MNLAYYQHSLLFQPNLRNIDSRIRRRSPRRLQICNDQKRCLRCSTLSEERDNCPTACTFHGLREKGLFSFSPPHQGIDGDWSGQSSVIVYKWNKKDNQPNTNRVNWKKRCSCCECIALQRRMARFL